MAAFGLTASRDFPTTPGAYDRTFNRGAYDVVVAVVQVAKAMHVASIDPAYQPDGPGYLVGARIRIDYAGGVPVPGASVQVEVDYPDGSTVEVNARTDAQGIASVARKSTQTGTYTFTVLSVTGPPAVYDPSQNVETSDSVTIP